jgi:hypothetical protein
MMNFDPNRYAGLKIHEMDPYTPMKKGPTGTGTSSAFQGMPGPSPMKQGIAGALGAVGQAFSQPEDELQPMPFLQMPDHGIIQKQQPQMQGTPILQAGDALGKTALL